jgi:hypothetical protein
VKAQVRFLVSCLSGYQSGHERTFQQQQDEDSKKPLAPGKKSPAKVLYKDINLTSLQSQYAGVKDTTKGVEAIQEDKGHT